MFPVMLLLMGPGFFLSYLSVFKSLTDFNSWDDSLIVLILISSSSLYVHAIFETVVYSYTFIHLS